MRHLDCAHFHPRLSYEDLIAENFLDWHAALRFLLPKVAVTTLTEQLLLSSFYGINHKGCTSHLFHLMTCTLLDFRKPNSGL